MTYSFSYLEPVYCFMSSSNCCFLICIQISQEAGQELWYWRRLLRVSWTARKSNQSILNEISPEYSLEGLMLKLKLQYFGHLMQRTDSLEKTLMLGKTEGRRRGRKRMVGWHHRLYRYQFEQAPGVDDGQGSLACCST